MRDLARWFVGALAALAVVGLLDGCGYEDKQPSSAVKLAPSATPTATPAHKRARGRHRRDDNRPTSTPTPTATPTPDPYVACDPNIRVRAATTTCPFAQNVFYEYYLETFGYPGRVTVRAWSAAASQWFRVRCAGDSRIVCRAGDGSEIRFSGAAVAAYDDEQAARYASTHNIGDSGAPTEPPDADAGRNIPNYENGTGYRVQCADGMYSHSGGRPGACSGHGGVGFDPVEDYADSEPVAPDYGIGEEIPNYDEGTGYRVPCADGMYSHSGGRPGACSGHGGVD